MNALLVRVNEWLAELAPRERLLVIVGAAFVAVSLLWLALWLPLVHAERSRAEALAQARAIAGQLEIAQAAVQKSRQGGRGAINRSVSLLSAVDQASKSGTLGKAPTRLQPEGDREVKVWLDDVGFDNLVRWLAELETRHGIVAQTAEIERESGAGLVSVRLSLVRP